MAAKKKQDEEVIVAGNDADKLDVAAEWFEARERDDDLHVDMDGRPIQVELRRIARSLREPSTMVMDAFRTTADTLLNVYKGKDEDIDLYEFVWQLSRDFERSLKLASKKEKPDE